MDNFSFTAPCLNTYAISLDSCIVSCEFKGADIRQKEIKIYFSNRDIFNREREITRQQNQ